MSSAQRAIIIQSMTSSQITPALLDSDDGRAAVENVQIRNYKSIGKCSVDLSRLTVLVGRNGAGKSNFLDALRFTVDGLQTSLDHAIKFRGGIDEVRRRSTGHPRNFGIRLTLSLPQFLTGIYSFEIAAKGKGGFEVKHESVRVRDGGGVVHAEYEVSRGTVHKATLQNMPPAVSDRLYLVTAANLPGFRGLYDALISMGFYCLNPEAMKEFQSPDAGELLHRDGGNLASVVARLKSDKEATLKRIRTFLESIVPGISDVNRVTLGPRETLEFRQTVQGSEHPWKFYAVSMSDGTLRALGALVAVSQLAQGKKPVTLIGIEEPETALHPAASAALVDALREATSHTQVLVTSHSADLLDRIHPEQDGLLVVESQQGTTRIAPVDDGSLKSIKAHLYSPGELLRMDQLQPNHSSVQMQEQLPLFDDEDDA